MTHPIAQWHAQVRDHLHHGIAPFWATRALDPEFGGFLTNFDATGQPLPTPEKYLNTQCRLIWFFSHLHHTHPTLVPNAASLARQGVDFLLKHFWDHTHGGFAWKTKRDGSPLDQGKVTYGLSFAIYALSEYTLATHDLRGLDYASRTFDLLQKFAADTLHGGYYENMEEDWSPAAPGFHAGDRKSLDSHMHLMESFTTLYAASGHPLHRRKLLEVTDLIVTRMIDATTGCGLNQFNLAWHSIPALAIRRTWNAERFGEQPAQPTQTTSYGHNTELCWLLKLALDTADADDQPYRPLMKQLLDHALLHGIDWQHGGIYRDGLRTSGQPIVLEKEFWQHAEALVGFLDGYQQFHQPRYLDAFAALWAFVQKHMITPELGTSGSEWRTLCDQEGNILDGNLGNPWKVAYHTGRSMIECERRLQMLRTA